MFLEYYLGNNAPGNEVCTAMSSYKKIRKNTFFLLMVLLANTNILPYLFSELLLAIFLSGSKYNNICKFYLIKVGKQFYSCLAVVPVPVLSQLSRYMLAVSIWQKYFLLSNTLQKEWKKKQFANSLENIPNRVSSITLMHFLDFKDICLAFYSYWLTRFCSIFDGPCNSHEFLYHPTKCVKRYL